MGDKRGNEVEKIIDEHGGDAADYQTEAIVTTKRKDTGEIVHQSVVTNGIVTGEGYEMKNGERVERGDKGLVSIVFLNLPPSMTIQIALKAIEVASRVANGTIEGFLTEIQNGLNSRASALSNIKGILGKHKKADRDIFKDNDK